MFEPKFDFMKSNLDDTNLLININEIMDITDSSLSGKMRHENDLIGDMDVPVEYYYGVQTVRARDNFRISRSKLCYYPEFIVALAHVKQAAALANRDLGLLEGYIADAIVKSCEEIAAGKFHEHFVVDMMQGGAGTSTNMNANEVIANRALEHLGHSKGEYEYCHPNNHVNLSQSTNDAYPTAIRIALYNCVGKLLTSLNRLIAAFRNKGDEFEHVLKMGRTQLQDAVPMTLGQEFEAFAVALSEEVERLVESRKLLLSINMGATAIGTGINSDPQYSGLCTKYMSEVTGLDTVLAKNLIAATSDTGDFVANSSTVKRLAIKLSKICNDLRLLSSGPRTGLNEINLPPIQPGSSIMPGKVNPVIPEVVNQIAFKVMGNDLTIAMASEAGQLQLNVMEPVIVYSLLESIDLLINGIETLSDKCVVGITANEEVCRTLMLNSIGLVTALNPYIGYEKSTELAAEALKTGRGIYELVQKYNLLTQEELSDILRPENMIKPRSIAVI